MNERLLSTLRQLRLSGLAQTLDVRLQEAAGHQLSHAEFLELILQDELLVRQERLIGRRIKAALFREVKPLDQFNWSFNPSIQKKQIFDLATCRFIREARDVCSWDRRAWASRFSRRPSATRRSSKGTSCCTARSSTWSATSSTKKLSADEKVLAKYLKPDLLIVDDMGMKQLPKRSGEYLFEIIMRRYETRSTMMTSNRPLEDWGKLVGDVPSATAILDRFLHHAEIVSITGKSYRLRNQAGKGERLAGSAKRR